MPLIFSVVLLVRSVGFLLFQTHRGIIRFTNTKDAERIFVSVSAGSALFLAINPIMFWLKGIYLIPYSIIIIDGVLTIFLMVMVRILLKAIYTEFRRGNKEKTNVIIYGAGETGITAKRAIERDAGAKYKVVCFIDDYPKKVGKKLQGIVIRSSSDLPELLKSGRIQLVILAVERISASRKQNLIDECLACNVKVFNVPPVKSWINGELSFKQIKKININDLLEREPIQLDTQIIREQIENKVILVTGAAGSIGSELVKQILNFNPGKLVLLDQAESALFELDRELHDELRAKRYEIVVGDIRSRYRMQNVFANFKPNLVFHAAAYKHVPLMESNPSEALLTNVKGTKVIADLAAEYNVEKFVMVSTDKAVNPTNVMGASKRIAEIYVQSLNKQTSTRYITTRFGNVLGSNGNDLMYCDEPILPPILSPANPGRSTDPEVNV
jgi:FlaA1/EpsC-like NDP-sugar epimerase